MAPSLGYIMAGLRHHVSLMINYSSILRVRNLSSDGIFAWECLLMPKLTFTPFHMSLKLRIMKKIMQFPPMILGCCFVKTSIVELGVGNWVIGPHVWVEIGLLAGFTSEQQSMSVDVIRKAYQATEEGFLSVVTKQWPMKPQIAAVGSCCLVGVICGGTLYIANVGDSRAVLGRLVRSTGEVLAIQLSAEHNVGIESVRQEMYSLHPDDSHIVVLKHNVWRVKGLIQVSYLCGW